MKTWSHYQTKIFDFVINGTGNGLVEACPGSGKTTVIEECVNRVPETKSVLLLAFNRHIRDELKQRMEHLPHVSIHTFNSLGNSVCFNNLGWYKVNVLKVNNILKFDVFGLTKGDKEKFKRFCVVQNQITRLIGLAKGHMIFSIEEMVQSWPKLANEFDIDIPETPEFEHYLLKTFSLDHEKTKVIDFDDQIAIPLRCNFAIPTFDRVFVDEAQDLTPAQIALTAKAIGSNGRALYVGDSRQAIYQFRGADSRAMENIHLMMDCVPLPLSICYRCDKEIVKEAQKIEPTIEWFKEGGEVKEVTENEFYKEAMPGDAVLCRTMAPLVQTCLAFIRKGQKALVKGRDIGDNLENLVREISQGDTQMEIKEFRNLLREYHQKESEKLIRNEKEERRIVLEDKVDTVNAVTEDCICVEDILNKFESIFSTETSEDAINLMTVHRAKGLEANVVYILRPDQFPHKLAKSAEALKAEGNLKYVAITRARNKLVWVYPNHPDSINNNNFLS